MHEGHDEDELYEKDQYFFHPDHLGSSSYVTNRKGRIYQHLEYFPFGETFFESEDNEDGSPYRFTAKELDSETGLYYFGARYYDPRTSVWQSGDPILAAYMTRKGSGGVFAPANLNLYGYVKNRPLVLRDPDGMQDKDASLLWNLTDGSGGIFTGALGKAREISGNLEAMGNGDLSGTAGDAARQEYLQESANQARDVGPLIAAISLAPGVARSLRQLTKTRRPAWGILGWVGFTRQAKPITLGLSSHLDDFTRRVDGESFRTWARADPQNWKIHFGEVMNSGRPIKFNLDGIDSPGPFGAAQRGATPNARATEWELGQIYQNRDWWPRIEWYRDGKIVSNPFE